MATLSGPRIRHTVAFSLRHDADTAETESFLAALGSLGAIDGVEDLEVVRQVGVKNTYGYGVVMEFSGQSDYEAYNSHPDHVAFVEGRWDVEVTDFIEIDFVALGDPGTSGSPTGSA